jgi:MFS family permease
VTAPPPVAIQHPSALAPLANRAFLGLWIANLLSNVGGWMQSTGAAWEMTGLTTDPVFVAGLAAAGTLPMFLFCFFAGILADRFDRRRYIIVCQFWMMGVAATLAVMAFTGNLTAWNLLALSF